MDEPLLGRSIYISFHFVRYHSFRHGTGICLPSFDFLHSLCIDRGSFIFFIRFVQFAIVLYHIRFRTRGFVPCIRHSWARSNLSPSQTCMQFLSSSVYCVHHLYSYHLINAINCLPNLCDPLQGWIRCALQDLNQGGSSSDRRGINWKTTLDRMMKV